MQFMILVRFLDDPLIARVPGAAVSINVTSPPMEQDGLDIRRRGCHFTYQAHPGYLFAGQVPPRSFMP